MRSGPLYLFLEPWRENVEFCVGHIILCVPGSVRSDSDVKAAGQVLTLSKSCYRHRP